MPLNVSHIMSDLCSAFEPPVSGSVLGMTLGPGCGRLYVSFGCKPLKAEETSHRVKYLSNFLGAVSPQAVVAFRR